MSDQLSDCVLKADLGDVVIGDYDQLEPEAKEYLVERIGEDCLLMSPSDSEVDFGDYELVNYVNYINIIESND